MREYVSPKTDIVSVCGDPFMELSSHNYMGDDVELVKGESTTGGDADTESPSLWDKDWQ